MKQDVVAVVCLLATVAVPVQMVKSELTRNHVEICVNETGSTVEAINKGQATLTRDYLCYLACIYKQFDVWTPENKINIENLKKMFSKNRFVGAAQLQRMVKNVETCSRIVIPDPDVCIALNQTMTCIAQEDAKLYKISIFDEACIEETGTTKEAINKGQVTFSRDYLCYMACLYKQSGIWMPGNKLNPENYKKIFSNTSLAGTAQLQTIVKNVETCNKLVVPDPDVCIALNQTLVCMAQEYAKIYKPKPIYEECMNESGITREQLSASRKPGVGRSRDYLCFLTCIYKKLNYWTSDNQLNLPKNFPARNTTDPVKNAKLMEAANECNKQVKPDADSCLAFNQTWNCLVLKDEKIGVGLKPI